jgi:beta-1,4-mannosyl-glycoprotein beta-1,4-N-acetylglucosaminyltransferase
MTIYSCTLFYNEFDLLDVKIKEELAGGVTQIIVVESSRTFQNTDKPLFLTENKYRFPDIKIITVGPEFNKVNHADHTIACFQREAIQRNAGIRDLDLDDNDVVIYADVDEIFPAEDIPRIVEAAQKHGIVHLIQRQFYYKLNLTCDRVWYGPFAVLGGYLKAGLTLNRLRTMESMRIQTNGKHFSYLMSPEQIAQKLRSFSHHWFSTPEYTDVDLIQAKINEGRDLFGRDYIKLSPVRMDESFPASMREDMVRWEPYFVPGATLSLDEIPLEAISLLPVYFNEFNEKRYEEVNQL